MVGALVGTNVVGKAVVGNDVVGDPVVGEDVAGADVGAGVGLSFKHWIVPMMMGSGHDPHGLYAQVSSQIR